MTDMTLTAPEPRKRRSNWQLLMANRLAAAGLFLFGFMVILAILAPVLPLPNPDITDQPNRLMPPFAEGHLLGTDHLGRDILSRLIWRRTPVRDENVARTGSCRRRPACSSGAPRRWRPFSAR